MYYITILYLFRAWISGHLDTLNMWTMRILYKTLLMVTVKDVVFHHCTRVVKLLNIFVTNYLTTIRNDHFIPLHVVPTLLKLIKDFHLFN